MKKLIELWKTNCEHCEAVKPIVAALEKEGYVFDKHNIEEQDGETLWHEYAVEIDANNKIMDYELGFINPQTRTVFSFNDRGPTKAELMKLTEGGESK